MPLSCATFVIIVSWELLFGLPAHMCAGCDMTILGPSPQLVEQQTSEPEQLQYETYDNATVRAHARNTTMRAFCSRARGSSAITSKPSHRMYEKKNGEKSETPVFFALPV